MAADEGRGAQFILGTTTWDTNALITSITFDPLTRSPLDTSHLATSSYRTFLAEDLVDAGGFTLEFHHNGDEQPEFSGAAEAAVIQYPLQSGWTTGAVVAGVAVCTEYKSGDAAVGELMKGTAKFKWTGTVTFTDHT